MTQKVYKDGDPCPKCGGFLYEGITPGKIVCLKCRFESSSINGEGK